MQGLLVEGTMFYTWARAQGTLQFSSNIDDEIPGRIVMLLCLGGVWVMDCLSLVRVLTTPLSQDSFSYIALLVGPYAVDLGVDRRHYAPCRSRLACSAAHSHKL